MVSTDIPKNYTASPSSYTGTPHLTINREATLDLDSSNAFEGPEKLLEVWFAPTSDAIPASAKPNGLKSVSAAKWVEMLDLVHCKILSVVESEYVDAYLLSESSMFVFPHKLVLKTCGITTLLSGLPRILEIAALSAGFPHVAAHPEKGIAAAATTHRVFYSRKNFLFPHQQRGPHRSWRDEVRALDRLFHGGSAYMIGKMNGEHWYLYITEPEQGMTPPLTPEHEKADGDETETRVIDLPEKMAAMAVNGLKSDEAVDETLEVLMTDLEPENAKQFYLEHASAEAEGRFFQRLHKARRSMSNALGTITEEDILNGNEGPIVKKMATNDDFDVFQQTSSDNAELSSDSDEDNLPAELTTEGHALGSVVSDSCGLSDVYPRSKYPDAKIDAYLFTPCGFSANGVIPAPAPADGSEGPSAATSTHYFTVHVTPEPQCSYASFETNVPAAQTGRETAEVVAQVVDIFRPGRFSVTLFEAKAGGPHQREAEKKASKMDAIKGYRRVDRIVHDLDGYDLVFRYYERLDWKGGAPRLGEAC